MSRLSDAVPEFCSSDHFFLLESHLKEDAEDLLSFWADQVGEGDSVDRLETALKKVAQLDVSLSSRQSFPDLLCGFLDYVATTGSFREAERWSDYVSKVASRYLEQFRDDGSVKGETVRKPHKAIGRNDPCPCGSGKKYKKCCMGQGLVS